jgi:hypothetical protein
MNVNLLARLNEEYPASQYSTAWTLEFGVPTRRVGNIENEATPAAGQVLTTKSAGRARPWHDAEARPMAPLSVRDERSGSN